MNRVYVNGTGCISAQRTFDSVFLQEAVLNENANILPVVTPLYKDYISSVAIRRMAKGAKNGIVASALAIEEAGLVRPDAIITGTGQGCLEDSDKFLKSIIENKEEFLAPTSFIQSTHNTVGAQIALGLQCNAYNFTYVQSAVSFESALLDAKMQINEGSALSVLVGGVDEISEHTATVFKFAGFIKADNAAPYAVLNSKTTGAVFSEGATFFVLEDKVKDSTYAEILDVDIVNRLEMDEVAAKVTAFLRANNMGVADIDALILGYNGDTQFDQYYRTVVESGFAGTPQIYYKHLCGEYNTASAFGLWVGINIVKRQQIPAILQVNGLEKETYNTILLYDQYRGADHSFILISKCRSTK